jgi:DNA modification methylase
MARRSKRKKRKSDQLKQLANSLEVYGLSDPKELEKEEQKRRGPPVPQAVRRHGDPALSGPMAEALAQAGHAERCTHGFHTYPAAMHPDMAAQIIGLCEGPVHDPFCGGGTVLIEAKLAGRQTSGSDLSPVAALVAEARCSGASLATPLRSASRKLAKLAQLRNEVEVPEEAEEWYEPHVSQEIGRIRDGIADQPEAVHSLLRAVLSSILVKCSYRKSDTSNQRHPYHRPPGTTATLFHKKARELGRMLEQMPDDPKAKIRLGDARHTPPPLPAGLVLTSPPYPGVYDYLPMQQLRHAWLGFSPAHGLAREVGSRRSFRSRGRPNALAEWKEDTEAWIGTQAKGLRPGGSMVVVVGDGLVGGRLVDALFPTVEAMKAAGLEIVARASADRPDHARSAIRIEHLVMGRKARKA